ncbi:MAG: division/cell wall cluster transcriptional repressor MraZ [Deltaproteobacteria bacterium]|nr:MAG: division/cell wall cluster transcriptional repressor MraZ [Deltaproteobacteria bacterium]
MFRGSSSHNLVQKGRLSIPARFKKVIESNGEPPVLFLSPMDGCIRAYTRSEWFKIERDLYSLKRRSERMRRFYRFLIGKTAECEIDKQNRIIIPQNLRDYAEIEKEIILAGVLTHFEIWSQAKWEEQARLLEEDIKLDSFQDEIAELGL